MVLVSPGPAAVERPLPAGQDAEAQALAFAERVIGRSWAHVGEWERRRAALTVHLAHTECEALRSRSAECCGSIRLAAAVLGWPDPTWRSLWHAAPQQHRRTNQKR